MPTAERAARAKARAILAAEQFMPKPMEEIPAHGWFSGQQIVVHAPGRPDPWSIDKIEHVSVMIVRTERNGNFRIRSDGTLRRVDDSVLGGTIYVYKPEHELARGAMARIRDNAQLCARREAAKQAVNKWIVSGDSDDFYALVIKLGRVQIGGTDLMIIGELWKKAKGE